MNKLKGFKYVNLEDNNGNTALFYAIDSIVIFQKLVDRGADYNHFNRNGENVLMYACRKNKLRLFDYVLKIPDFNVAQFDNFGRNLPMILVECNHSQELISFYNYHSDFDINFVNKSNESLLSIFINHYISELKEKDELIKTKYYEVIRDYGLMIRALVESGCDFNAYIDGDGNTPMMFFLLIEDYVSAYYLLTKFPKLDLSIKNKYNANASYMAFFINRGRFRNRVNLSLIYGEFLKAFFEHSTFDYSYLDDYGNSLLNHCIIKNEDEVCYFLKYMNDEIVSQINNKKEASLIIASKFGKSQIIENLLTYPYIRKNINHTDCHGNTALFYAVQLRDKETIELLLKHGDNPYIPNNEGNTIIETAKAINAFNIVELIEDILAVNNNGKGNLKKTENKDKELDKLDNQIKNYCIIENKKEYDYLMKYEFISYYQPSYYKDLI